MPVPIIVMISPTTFWFTLNDIVINPKSADVIIPLNAPAINDTAAAPKPDIPNFSAATAPASEATAPIYIVPSTPRLIFPDFSVIISPTVARTSGAPARTAAIRKLIIISASFIIYCG